METQQCLAFEDRCPCGGNKPLDINNADYVRTIGSKTIAFCFARCARDFDDHVARNQLQLATV